MHAVTFQAPGEVRVDERPSPSCTPPTTRSSASRRPASAARTCTSSTGASQIEPGFTIGHEYVGTVVAAGDAVSAVAVGDRVLGCFQVACGDLLLLPPRQLPQVRRLAHLRPRRGAGRRCRARRPSRRSCPHANLTLRRVPEGMPNDVALFAGDVMGTGYHASQPVRPGDSVAVLGLGPVGLCAVQAARAAGARRSSRSTPSRDRLEMARSFGAQPVHLTEESRATRSRRYRRPRRRRRRRRRRRPAGARARHPPGRASAAPCPSIGVYAERCEVHMGLLWIKALTLETGHANVIGHLDRVLALMAPGALDPRRSSPTT